MAAVAPLSLRLGVDAHTHRTRAGLVHASRTAASVAPWAREVTVPAWAGLA